MKMLPSFLAALAAVFLFTNCADEQDFSQYDDIGVIPTLEASLIYVESPEDFINESPGINFYSQTFNFDAFNEAFFAERVLDGFITYEVENTTSKRLDFSIEFLDDAGNVLDIENFSIDPAPTALLQRQIAYGGPTGRGMDIIRNTSAISISGTNLGDNISVSTLPDPIVVLRSSAQFRLRLK